MVIIEGIEDGKLHYRINNVFGNLYYNLILSEVKTFIDEKYGGNYLKDKNQEIVSTDQKEIEEMKLSKAKLWDITIKINILKATVNFAPKRCFLGIHFKK